MKRIFNDEIPEYDEWTFILWMAMLFGMTIGLLICMGAIYLL